MLERFPIREDETLEDLGRRGFSLIQKEKGFRFGEDTVLLAHFVASMLRKKNGLRGLELGTNCGAASVLLAARREDVVLDGIELDETAYGVFCRNVQMNELEERIVPFQGDVRDWPPPSRKGWQYDFVFCNPPYYVPGRGAMTQGDGCSGVRNARFELNGGVEDFVRTGAKVLIPGGVFCLVHRAERLEDCFAAFGKYGVRGAALRLVHPTVDAKCSVFLLAGRKGGGAGGLRVLPPLVLRGADGGLSEELQSIYC